MFGQKERHRQGHFSENFHKFIQRHPENSINNQRRLYQTKPEKERRPRHTKGIKTHKDNIIPSIVRYGVVLLSSRFVHFLCLAAEALIARYRGISNILSRERIRKRRRMDHYVTYSKSYYAGRYRGRKLYALSLSFARARPHHKLLASSSQFTVEIVCRHWQNQQRQKGVRATHKHYYVTLSLKRSPSNHQTLNVIFIQHV